jgi:shikimate dehydrogenase
VSHSLSPAMHNRAFEVLSLNKVYVPFEVLDLAPAMAGLKALGVRGVSVTIPYKVDILPYLDSIDPMAEKIGAVNTLAFEEGRVHGFNTDWLGANRALAQVMELPGSRVLLLGAGGAARAIGFGLKEGGAQVLLASRTPERGRRLAGELGCEWYDLRQLEEIRADVLVNATSVGMAPNLAESPAAGLDLATFPVVMDIVYSPLETRLLREAAQAGCRVIDGLEMLLFQGAGQFEAWTAQAAPLAEMRSELRARVAK